MDIISKINESWKVGASRIVECEDGTVIDIGEGIKGIFSNAELTNADKDKKITKNRDVENEIGAM